MFLLPFADCVTAERPSVTVYGELVRREFFQRNGTCAARNVNAIVNGVVSSNNVVKAVGYERVTVAEVVNNIVAAVVNERIFTRSAPK